MATHEHVELIARSEPCYPAGASGYVMKRETADDLLAAIRRVVGGGVFVSDRAMAAKWPARRVRGELIVEQPHPTDSRPQQFGGGL